MRFCISGMPRCRTAWLTALLLAHGSRVYHDAYARGLSLDGQYGVVDPAVALFTPEEGVSKYVGRPSFCIHAESLTERLRALELAAGVTFSDSAMNIFHENFRYYANFTTVVCLSELEDNDIVGEIVTACTKQVASSDIISTFQLLKVEEHMQKAKLLLESSNRQWRSREFLRSLEHIENGTSITRDENSMALHTRR